jgi:transcriptional regulator with XRE-family HTH domain
MSSTDEAKVTVAVRELRLTLRDSQEAFAQRVKVSVRTVARYETVRPPRGKPLAQLHRIAVENGAKGVAAVLEEALTRELYGDADDLPAKYDQLPPRTQAFHLARKEAAENNLILEAVTRLVQEKKYKHLRKPVKAALAPIFQDMEREAKELLMERFRDLEIPQEDSK